MRKIESPPYNPRSNGLAECGVQIVKQVMKTFDATKCEFSCWLQKILLHHPHCRGKSPAELIFGRKLRLPVVTDYEMGEVVDCFPQQCGNQRVQPVTFSMNKGRNTSYVIDKDKLVVAPIFMSVGTKAV